MARNKVVLLYGPEIRQKKGAYGGGVGGYTRNMQVYLENFSTKEYVLIPSYHTVRGNTLFNSFIIRFFIDAFRFINNIVKHRPSIVHILAIYGTAIPRELIISGLSKVFGAKVIYEVKAGTFIDWYSSTNLIFKTMARWTVALSDLVLSEGKLYIPFIQENFKKQAYYFPNVVPDKEVPDAAETKLQNKKLKVLFVGYCYKGKGVYELVQACKYGAEQHDLLIELTLIGKEAESFSNWLSSIYRENKNLKVVRMGIQPHSEIINQYKLHDIYCYPSYHQGEGHNNSINEAMMMGMVIISSKAGFLEDVLGYDSAYLLDEVTPNKILDYLITIQNNRAEALQKAENAYVKLKQNYTTSTARNKIVSFYRDL